MDTKFFASFNIHLHDMFNECVEKISDAFKQSCTEELYTTKTLVWELEEFDPKISEKEEKGGYELLAHIYDHLKTRFVRNVRRKFYNMYLAPFV